MKGPDHRLATATPPIMKQTARELRRMLSAHGAYIMSLFVHDKPPGLLYGDGTALNGEGYRQFRDLCLEASTVLGTGSRVVENPQQQGIPQTPPG